ncbi:DUF167 domain-containing protein [Candidatus Uhrbacteria bacterium]|nr:DUF167 domain-containing protein [Candidatus Uhrbacteria bacterium]
MILTVHVKPSARKNAVAWLDEDTLKVSVTAAPEGGKANRAVIELLAEELSLPKSQIEIVRGLTAKMKHVKVTKTWQK